MKNKINILIISIIILSISFVSAVGIGNPYFKGNPFLISPGQTGTASLIMQNAVGGEDIRLKVKVIQGNEIASIKENEYLIPAGSLDTTLPITIKIPSNATLNTTHEVKVSFKTITSSEEGGVAMGIGIITNFNVLIKGGVEEQPKEKLETRTLIIIGIIILIIIMIIVLKKEKLKKIFK